MVCKNMWIARMDYTPYGPIPRYVPCGHCDDCWRMKRREWAYRCMAEAKSAYYTLFVTLTYKDTDNVERYEYVQNFFKLLRKKFKFRYFGCTEYGDTFGRLHHHLLLFLQGQDFGPWSECRQEIVTLIQKAWRHGFVHVLLANIKTINYVVGYVEKKLIDKEHRVHNFMSLRQPIGWSYAKIGLDFLRANGYDVLDGQKVALPRAFKKRAKIEITTRKMYDKFKEREKIRLALEQERGKDYNAIVDEQSEAHGEVQRRGEACRRSRGQGVRKILRRLGQLPLPAENDVTQP